jgi:hypothetical protein
MLVRARTLLVSLTVSALALSFVVGGCKKDDGGTAPTDATPPAAVTDLTVQAVGVSSVTLRWSAPGDDGATGQATTYDLRDLPGGSSAFVWTSASPVPGLPAPGIAGTVQTFTVSGLSASATYSFALKTADEMANWSALSNVVSAETGGATTSCLVAPTSLEFGLVVVGSTADRTFTITNTGTLVLSGTVMGAVAPFSLISGGGAYTLAAGESRTVTVHYAPTASGSYGGSIDTGDSACSDVTCSGTATNPVFGCSVSPEVLMFPLTPVNSFTESQFVIRNSGTLNIAGSVSGSCPMFEIMSGGGAYALTPGQQKTVIVRFVPTAEGTYACTLDTGLAGCADVSCSGTCGSLPPGCTVNPTAMIFPDTPDGSSLDLNLTVTNDSEVAISGSISTTSPMFSIVDGEGAYTLQPGEMFTATVRYAPTTHGAHAGVVHTGLPCIDVPCAGTSVEEHPDCNVYPLVVLDFTPRSVGTWEERTFNIQNLGTRILTGTVGQSCPPFEITGGGGAYSLRAGQSHTVTMRFAPTSAGTFACEISSGGSCTNVACIGVALAAEDQPTCTIQPAQLIFPSTALGSSSDLSFTITNSGTGTLTGSLSESCDDFDIIAGGDAYSLTAGQSRTVTVRYAPAAAGTAQCDISTGTYCSLVHCTGTGTQGAPQ